MTPNSQSGMCRELLLPEDDLVIIYLAWIVSPQKVLENLQRNAFQNNRTNIRGF
jgi:hypothetical protein